MKKSSSSPNGEKQKNIHTDKKLAEDSKLRALISNNFGRRKNDPSKDRKALATYVELKGNNHGGDRKSRCQNGTLNLDEIAKELNMSKRNLPPAQRLAVMDKFKKKIQEQATFQKEESSKKFHGNQYKEVSSPIGEQTKNRIHTDKELAKMAGVGTGTVARYPSARNRKSKSSKVRQMY